MEPRQYCTDGKEKLNKEDEKMGVNMTCDIKWDKIF